MEALRFKSIRPSDATAATRTGACLVSIDAHGCVREWTQDAAALFGHSVEHVQGLSIQQLLPFLAEPSGEREGWCKRADGSMFRGLVAPLSTMDRSRQVAFGTASQVLVITDITARYMREQAALRVRECLDEVSSGVAQLAFFSLRYAQDELQLWGAYAEVLGCSRPLRRLAELTQLVHPDDCPELTASIERTLQTGQTLEVPLRLRAERGERSLLCTGRLVDRHGGELVGTLSQVKQTSQLDQALRTSEALLQAVLNATSDGIVLMDAQGAITSLNQTALSMLRGSESALRGTQWNALRESAGAPREVNGRSLDGSIVTMEFGLPEPVAGVDGLSTIVLRDVTQLRGLERQVLEITEQLQRQIGQDLHDGLGQLLTGTAFLAKGLQVGLPSELQPQGQRIVELINIAIARVRSLAHGLSPIHVESQSLRAVLCNTVTEASELLGVACALEFDESFDSAHPTLIAQLCLIAREAITNAVRHGQARNIIVRLARGLESMALSVEDDGVGISHRDKPFDGLGLRSMRQRAKMIDGQLEILRTPSGTTVRCSWPGA